jgi:hypothetical protein
MFAEILSLIATLRTACADMGASQGRRDSGRGPKCVRMRAK